MSFTIAGSSCTSNITTFTVTLKPHVCDTSSQLLQFNLQGRLQFLHSSVLEDACSMCCCKYFSRIIADGHSKKHEFWQKHRAVDILKA